MAAHVIVLANRTAAAPELIEALVHRSERGPIHATLVMPAAGPGTAARAGPSSGWTRRWRPGVRRHRALRGRRLRPGPAGGAGRGLGPDAPRRGDRLDAAGPVLEVVCAATSPTPSRATRGVSVLHVVAHDPDDCRTTSPAPVHEKAPLGPLSVLAWGGKRA